MKRAIGYAAAAAFGAVIGARYGARAKRVVISQHGSLSREALEATVGQAAVAEVRRNLSGWLRDIDHRGI